MKNFYAHRFSKLFTSFLLLVPVPYGPSHVGTSFAPIPYEPMAMLKMTRNSLQTPTVTSNSRRLTGSVGLSFIDVLRALVNLLPLKGSRSAVRHQEHRLCSHAHGFSLIEVMFSLVILAIGVLALTQLQLTVTQGNGSTNTMAMAVSLAEQKIESFKSASYATIQSESPTAVTASGGTYTRQVIVTNNQPMLNVKTVQVIVSGADGQRTFTVPLSTVIAQ